jgi:arsenate reductase
MTTVLFVCRQNAGRSQISQALFEQAAGNRHRALSAGTTPAADIHPPVLEVMQEIGIDLINRIPILLTRELAKQADLIITMGCGDECPVIPGKQYLDWDLPDPADQPLATVRAIRNDINTKVRDLIEKLDQATDAASLSPRASE